MKEGNHLVNRVVTWSAAFLLVVFFISPLAFSEIYTYVDEKGVIHFTNVPVKSSKEASEKLVHYLKKEIRSKKTKGSFYLSVSPSPSISNGYTVGYNNRVVTSLFGYSMPPVSSNPQEKYYDQYIKEVARNHGLDPNLVKAVIRAESGFNPQAISPKGAMGLMQLMPGTAYEVGVKNPFHPIENLVGGVLYLKEMLRLFNNDLVLALAAYNAGPNAVKQYGGIPPYDETQKYVQRVLQYYSYYKNTM